MYISVCTLLCSLPLCSVFKDKETPSPFVEKFPNDKDGQSSAAALPDHIHGDCMGMGMGCCCLQVTKQHSTITEHLSTGCSTNTHEYLKFILPQTVL